MTKSRDFVDISGAIFIFGVLLRLFLSNGFLNEYIPYTNAGGSLIFKVHPGTYFILIAYIISVIENRPSNGIADILKSSILFLLAIILVAFVQVIKFGFNSVAYILDTFLIAVISSLYIERSRPFISLLIIKFLTISVLINSLVALVEFSIEERFLPGSVYEFTFFRSYAFFGHPLLNSLITGVAMLFVICTRYFRTYTWLYVSICLIALFAFGGRAGLAGFLLCSILLLIGALATRLVSGRLRISELLTVPIFALLLIGSIAYIVAYTSLGERIREMSSLDDNSTAARLNLLTIFEPLTDREILWGISPEMKQMLIEQSNYFDTIENFWIDISLSFGAIMFFVFSIALLNFIISVSRNMYFGSLMICVYFVGVASTNNALSVKSPALLFFVVLMVSSRKHFMVNHSVRAGYANRN